MKIYSVHQRPYWEVSESAAPDEAIVFVREGFSWFAMFLPLVWALWHRLWLVAGAIVVIGLVLNLGVRLLEIQEIYSSLIGGALLVWFGFEANDLRRWSLLRADWREIGVVGGRDRNDAEWRYFAARHRESQVA
ncbi:MAG: DUF2628 domain-containing protein [Proteobacteria bacterium]|nr:DUF2628 domain-containing protein [Pseudomonadota bacterium]